MKQELKAKLFDFETGGVSIIVLNQEQAEDLDIKHLDRVKIHHNNKSLICVVNISDKVVKEGEIGFFEEPAKELQVKKGEKVTLEIISKPKSLKYIQAKLEGEELTYEEVKTVVQDIVDDALTEVELTAFITGSYCRGLSMEESYHLTRAMVETGETLDAGVPPIFDKHSIGGVPGNRVTMLLVPIISGLGYKIPKTSSRAITSPAGTADTVEIFSPVDLTKKELEEVLKKTNGFMAWGGSINLAPADDKIIEVEKPLSIDAEGQLLASIMAKKMSVGATHIVIDMPMGPGSKLPTMNAAEDLKQKFERLAEKLGVKVYSIINNGSQPVGNGIGTGLEARDILWCLKNDKRAPKDLKEKGILFSAKLLELADRKNPEQTARNFLESGKAYKQFQKIIKAQGGNPDIKISDIPIGDKTYDYKAEKKGIISIINNSLIAKIARAAGAPHNKGAGVYMHKKMPSTVKKGDVLLTIHSETEAKLSHAIEIIKEKKPIIIQ